jgi:hypothetical protein
MNRPPPPVRTRREALRALAVAAAAGWTARARAEDPAPPDAEPPRPKYNRHGKGHPKLVLPVDGPPAQPAVPPPGIAPDLWFPVNEVLEYTIRWGVIPVGSSVVWTEWVEHEGAWRIAIRMRTRTNKVLSTLYPVDDYVESIVDPVSFLPLRFVKKINEGRNRYDQLTEFDHASRVAAWHSFIDEREKEFEIQADTRDIPSLLWWLRKDRFEPGVPRKFEVMADDKMYALTLVPEARERIALDRYGRVPTLRIEPQAAFGGVFVRKGRMWAWIAEDARRIAVQIAAEVPVGRVRITIDRVRGPGDDAWVA